jgi:hypothetical protein
LAVESRDHVVVGSDEIVAEDELESLAKVTFVATLDCPVRFKVTPGMAPVMVLL